LFVLNRLSFPVGSVLPSLSLIPMQGIPNFSANFISWIIESPPACITEIPRSSKSTPHFAPKNGKLPYSESPSTNMAHREKKASLIKGK
jgi:hypothetical protein